MKFSSTTGFSVALLPRISILNCRPVRGRRGVGRDTCQLHFRRARRSGARSCSKYSDRSFQVKVRIVVDQEWAPTWSSADRTRSSYSPAAGILCPPRPPQVSMSKVNATCAATITRCVRFPCALPITRRALRLHDRGPCPAARVAARARYLNRMAVVIAKPVLNSSTSRFISITDSAGKESAGTPDGDERNCLSRQQDAQRPPATAMAKDSVSNCRTMRPRAAPRAERTASSCCRCAPRQQQDRHVGATDPEEATPRAPNSKKSAGSNDGV